MSDVREFHLGDVLSITTGLLLSPRHVDGVYDILNWMTQDNLFTHQLVRAAEECKPWLLRQHPQLAQIVAPEMSPDEMSDWLTSVVAEFGETWSVERIPRGDYTYRDPLQELIEQVGPDKVIGVPRPPQ